MLVSPEWKSEDGEMRRKRKQWGSCCRKKKISILFAVCEFLRDTVPNPAPWEQQCAEIFISSPQEKEKMNITFVGPSYHRLTLAALHPLQEGEKFTRRGIIQAPSVGNLGFQGKGRQDPAHVLRAFRKAGRMRTDHWWLRSYGMASSSGWPRSPRESMQHTGISGLPKSKWTLLNQGLHCC